MGLFRIQIRLPHLKAWLKSIMQSRSTFSPYHNSKHQYLVLTQLLVPSWWKSKCIKCMKWSAKQCSYPLTAQLTAPCTAEHGVQALYPMSLPRCSTAFYLCCCRHGIASGKTLWAASVRSALFLCLVMHKWEYMPINLMKVVNFLDLNPRGLA